jgi:hypothetical protein
MRAPFRRVAFICGGDDFRQVMKMRRIAVLARLSRDPDFGAAQGG